MPNELTQMGRDRVRAKVKSICSSPSPEGNKTEMLRDPRRTQSLSSSVFSSLTLSRPNPRMQMRLSPQQALANSRNMRTYVFDYLFHEFAAHFTWKINKEMGPSRVRGRGDTL